MGTVPTEREIWKTEGEAKRQSVQSMFAKIAPSYDRLNSLMSLRGHKRWRAIAVRMLGLQAGDRALDVCCGTGDFLVPLRETVGKRGTVLGIDFCAPMLQVAQQKLPEVRLSLGDACALPVRSSQFDAVTVGWGLRNVADLEGALREMARVLVPGGRMVCLDMARPRNPLVRWGSRIVGTKILPILGSIFGHRDAYTYLPESTERFASREELKAAMERAGFVDVVWRDLMMGNICIHYGRKA